MHNRSSVLGIAVLALLPRPGRTGGFEPAADKPAPTLVAASATAVDWSRARALPAAFLLAAADARRERAGAVSDIDDLKPGADGGVDLSLSTVIDLTLRNNLELRVSSYAPALSSEALEARESLYDPLLRFTLSLLSSTNPTSATLEGADVLSRKQGAWNFEGIEQLPWGGEASVGFSNQRDKSNNVFATINPVFDSNLSFALVQPLLRNFGRDVTEREIRIAKNDQASSRESFRQSVMTTVTGAADAYWTLYGRIQNLEVQRAGLALAQDLLRINKTRVEVGTMAPLDIALAEAEVARNEEGVIAAEHDVKTGEDRIRQLIRVPLDSPLWRGSLRPVDAPAIEHHAIDVYDAIQVAFRKRPELVRQSLQIGSDEIRAAYARNQKKPALNLQASYGVAGLGGTQIVRSGFGDDTVVQTTDGGYGDALSQLFSFDFDTWRVAAVVELPLFNQLANANHAAAILTVRQDQDQLETLRQNIAVEVLRLAREAETSQKQIQAAGATRRAQEKRLDAETKKFEHGLTTNFEVQQAQKDVTDARSTEVQAVTSYRRSLNALELVMGTVLETYGVRIAE